MKKTAYNPYLPGNEYIPDAEPYVFGNRVYVFGSHDRSGGENYCAEDYVCWSAPLKDLADWRNEGVIYRRNQDPDNPGGIYPLFAPDVAQGPDGRYYLYYTVAFLKCGVAVCDTPAGRYEYCGSIRYADGRLISGAVTFDPAVLNDNGRVWLYYGFSPHFKPHLKEFPATEGGMCVELESDMLTFKSEPAVIVPDEARAAGTGYEGHGFFEAASIRKTGNSYYFVYSSRHMHELCYAISTQPDRGFVFGGTLVSNGDIGYCGRPEELARNAFANNHGGMLQIGGQWYIFYHRHTHGTQFSRQSCAEPITVLPDGSISQAEMTSCGLNGGSMPAKGEIPALYACNLYKRPGGKLIRYGPPNVEGPYVTESQGLCPPAEHLPIVANITDASLVGFRYLLFDGTETTLRVCICGKGKGRILAYADDENERLIATFAVDMDSDGWTVLSSGIPPTKGKRPLRFLYLGEGSLKLRSYMIC